MIFVIYVVDVFPLSQISIHDNFFELGGYSLPTPQMISRVRAICEVELSLRGLFDAPTIVEMAEQVGRAHDWLADTDILPFRSLPRDHGLPRLFAQQRLWFFDQRQPQGTAHTIASGLRLFGPLDTAALEHALNGIVQRYGALRTIFTAVDGDLVQVMFLAPFTLLRCIDLQFLPDELREATLQQRANEDAQRPFDLRTGPLLRTQLLRLGLVEHVLLLCRHHTRMAGQWGAACTN